MGHPAVTWSEADRAWIAERLRRINGKRTARLLLVEGVVALVEKMVASGQSWALLCEDVDDGRQHASLCLCVRTPRGVVVGVSLSRTGPASPAKAFSDIDRWDHFTPTANDVTCERWAARSSPDRRLIAVEPARPQSLLDSILADPERDEPRRVYADALSEQGDPKGEFISVQCALAAGGPELPEREELERRERELLSAHSAQWTKDIDPRAALVAFARGFIGSLTVLDLERLEASNAALAREPIDHVVISTRTAVPVVRLLSQPWLSTVRSLDFRSAHGAPSFDSLTTLLQTRKLSSLTSLGFLNQSLGDEGVALLAKEGGAAFPRLGSLTITSTSLSARAVEALVRSTWFLKLERIAIEGCGLGADSAELFAAARFQRLSRLSLASNRLGDPGAIVLAQGRAFGSLDSLWLTSCGIRHSGATALLQSPNLAQARLFLEGNSIGKGANQQLAARPAKS